MHGWTAMQIEHYTYMVRVLHRIHRHLPDSLVGGDADNLLDLIQVGLHERLVPMHAASNIPNVVQRNEIAAQQMDHVPPSR